MAVSDEIQQENIVIRAAVQQGRHTRAYDRGRFSVARENGVPHLHSLVYEYLRGSSRPAT